VFTRRCGTAISLGFGTITDPLNNGVAFPRSIIPLNRLNPASVSIINNYTLLPNRPGTSNNYAGVSLSSTTQDQYMGRVDHTFGVNDSIFGHAVYQGANTPSIGVNPYFGSADHPQSERGRTVPAHVQRHEAQRVSVRLQPRRREQFSTRRGTGFTAAKDLGINGLLVGGPMDALSRISKTGSLYQHHQLRGPGRFHRRRGDRP
jgi:hypothetical protein